MTPLHLATRHPSPKALALLLKHIGPGEVDTQDKNKVPSRRLTLKPLEVRAENRPRVWEAAAGGWRRGRRRHSAASQGVPEKTTHTASCPPEPTRRSDKRNFLRILYASSHQVRVSSAGTPLSAGVWVRVLWLRGLSHVKSKVRSF